LRMGKFIEVYRVKLTHSKELYRVMSPHPELTLESGEFQRLYM